MVPIKKIFEPKRKIEILEIVTQNVWVTNERIYDCIRVKSRVTRKSIYALLKRYENELLIEQYKKPHIKHKNRPGRPKIKRFFTITKRGKERLDYLLKNNLKNI